MSYWAASSLHLTSEPLERRLSSNQEAAEYYKGHLGFQK